MKKFIAFISFVILSFLCYFYVVNKPKNYEIEYIVKDYNVIEKYDKSIGYYNFTLKKDDVSFDFVSSAKYSSKRKIVLDIEEEGNDDVLCVKPDIRDDEFEMICYKDGEYIDKFMAGLEERAEANKMNTISNVDIYDNTHDYLIWNNKGYTSLLDEKDYKFLSQESYDNLLTYQWENYIIVADYDQSRTFNKFYIYDNESRKVDSWDLDVDISFDSYFMGDLDNYVYLFDKKNKVQYRLDIKKKKLKVTSDKEGAIFYENELTSKALDSLAYNVVTFIKDNKYNYILENGKLYLRVYGSDKYIRISDREIDYIVHADNETLYYLANEELYSYNINSGEKLLLVNFEWNFTYLNKIFIFD